MDISKKVKSALQTKIKQGITTSYTIYGYKKDNIDKNQLLIDEPAAAVVRRIFQLSLDGITLSNIAKILNNECIPTPSAHKSNTGNKRNWLSVSINERSNIWTSDCVLRILKDERYTGTFVGGKRESDKLGSNKKILKNKEEWVRIPNNHPTIITQEQFDKVAEMKQKKASSKIKKTSEKRPLYKKIWCRKCGHIMRYDGRNTNSAFYFCYTAKYSDEHGCMQGKIREKELNEAVIITLSTQINLFINTEKVYRMIKNNKSNISTDNSISHFRDEINNLQSNKRKLYEQYKNGKINHTIYLQERGTLEKALTNKTTECEALVFQQQIHQNKLESIQKISQNFLKYQSVTGLTKKIADEFIDAVNVYDTDRIEVKFKFKDGEGC